MRGATIEIAKVTVLGPKIEKHHAASEGFFLDRYSDVDAAHTLCSLPGFLAQTR